MTGELQKIKWWEVEEPPDKEEIIKKIESRTKADIINILKKNGLGKSSKMKNEDYSTAKRICFEGLFINSEIYDRQIGWIIKYLKF